MLKYCVVFVCQSGELEIKAMLLAASLKRHWQGEGECVVAIPTPASRWGELSTEVDAFVRCLGFRTVAITNRIDEQYGMGNKVACLGIETSAERLLFLDSDILCLQAFLPRSEQELSHAPFCAKPADGNSNAYTEADWQKVYALFGRQLPARRIMTTVSDQLIPPYFNAGVVVVQNGMNFGNVWETCCQKIDAAPDILNKRPWLDQIALPVAVERLHLPYHCLDERWNFPAHQKPLPKELPIFCHYHWPSVLRRETQLNQYVVELTENYPPLRSLLARSPEWAQLLKPYYLRRAGGRQFPRWFAGTSWRRTTPLRTPPPEAIITGIPRSGTSYLCRLIHSLQDCVALNEPSQIFEPLQQTRVPWRVATLYQEWRRDILNGCPIENKVLDGRVIADTAKADQRTMYLPQVSRPNFLLCTKNTVTYLSRLPELQRVLPHARILACVRHPFDTIASWKATFPHLRQADVETIPVGHVNDSFLAAWQRSRLVEIAKTTDEALKRALFWRYLAECVLTYQEQVVMIHYEDIVQQPVKTLKTILRQVPGAPPFRWIQPIAPSSLRQQREILEKNDREAIGDVCRQYAAELGYTDFL